MSLATDVASLALPLVPAGASHAIRAGKLAAKAANAADTAVDVVKVANAIDGAADAAKTAENIGAAVVTGARRLDNLDYAGAERIYDVIRGASDDVATIARNTNIPQYRVERVKKHLFYDTHQLDDAVRRFDADPEIANAWMRLSEGTYTQADLDLFSHELFESRFERIFNTTYRQAHDAANRAGRLSGLE